MGRIDFDGRVAIITGAGRGLGRSYALELAGRGAAVVVNDFDGAAATEVVEEISRAGGRATAAVASVAEVEGGQAIVDAALSSFGRVDVLVNNAGILRDRAFHKLEQADVDAVLGVHLRGAFAVTRPAFTAMRDAGYGRIVFTTSSVGLFGNFGQTNYAAAKLGIVGLARSLAVEGRRQQILVNVVAPSAATAMTGEMYGDLAETFSTEQVTPMTVFLASEQCDVTGQIYWAGGGRFARVDLVQSAGWVSGEATTTAEQVRDHLAEIDDMSDAFTPPDAMSELARAMKELGLQLPTRG